MPTISELTRTIVSDLHQRGFINEANELQHLADLALDETLLTEARENAVKQIQTRCHVKWLKDIYLPHLSQKDWWGKLEKLGKSAQKNLKSI